MRDTPNRGNMRAQILMTRRLASHTFQDSASVVSGPCGCGGCDDCGERAPSNRRLWLQHLVAPNMDGACRDIRRGCRLRLRIRRFLLVLGPGPGVSGDGSRTSGGSRSRNHRGAVPERRLRRPRPGSHPSHPAGHWTEGHVRRHGHHSRHHLPGLEPGSKIAAWSLVTLFVAGYTNIVCKPGPWRSGR